MALGNNPRLLLVETDGWMTSKRCPLRDRADQVIAQGRTVILVEHKVVMQISIGSLLFSSGRILAAGLARGG